MALEARADQLQELASVYRRALAMGFEDEYELSERGLFSKKTKLEFSWRGDIPENWKPKITKNIQSSYNNNKQLAQYSNCQVSYFKRGPDNMIVSGKYYNGDKPTVTSPSVTYNVIWN